MKIRLNEIPADGREYSFDREKGELDRDLEDLIGDRPYDVEMYIKPIGNAYELRGHLITSVQEVCSKCGYDFEMPIERKINEILFEEQEEYRKAHSVQGNHSVDFLNTDAPSMTPVRGEIFDPGEFIHECIALEEPLYPTCGPKDSCLHEDEVRAIKSKLESEAASFEEKRAVNPAFSVLKNIEIKTNRKN